MDTDQFHVTPMSRNNLSRRRWPAAVLLIVLVLVTGLLLVLLRLHWWAHVAWAVVATPMVTTSLKVILRGEYYDDE